MSPCVCCVYVARAFMCAICVCSDGHLCACERVCIVRTFLSLCVCCMQVCAVLVHSCV